MEFPVEVALVEQVPELPVTPSWWFEIKVTDRVPVSPLPARNWSTNRSTPDTSVGTSSANSGAEPRLWA